MSKPVGDDPIELLRRVDPVDPDQLPSASLARMSARVQEDIMDTSATSPRWRRHLIPGAAAVLVAGIALVLVVGGTRPTPASPGTTPGIAIASPVPATTSPAPGGPGPVLAASCVEQYSPQAVAKRAFAFDGTVTAIDGDEVTFRVGRTFTGDPGGTVTLTAGGMTGTAITSAGGPHLEVGERYLVAGEDHFAWPCGFTQAYDPAVAAEWTAATD